LLITVSLPIFIACVLGYLFQKYRNPDSKSLADLSLYILAPCLVIYALATTDHRLGTIMEIAAFTALHTLLCWGASILIGRLSGASSPARRALDLTTIFGNSNNYGLPLLLLAFGSAGFALGVTYVVGQIILVNTLGLYLASRATFEPKQAIQQIAKSPLIYAVLVGLFLFVTSIKLPESLLHSFKLPGDAYAGIVLLLLGIQLKKAKWSRMLRKEVVIASLLRIFLVPVLAIFALRLLSIEGTLAAVLLVQSSMPAAVNCVVLAEKYGGDKEAVALTVAATTLISFIWLPFLIALSKWWF
jgi:malate permease and related proteins